MWLLHMRFYKICPTDLASSKYLFWESEGQGSGDFFLGGGHFIVHLTERNVQTIKVSVLDAQKSL